MARQEDECWRCGAPWAVEGAGSPSPSSPERAAPAHVANGRAFALAADGRRETTEARLAADRWAGEGGSFDPDGDRVPASRAGSRSAAASLER
jgi:hypothetical protein